MPDEGKAARPGSRREGRERILGFLYEAEAKGLSVGEVVAALPIRPDGYARRLLEGLSGDLGELDAVIDETSLGWRIDRMPAIDRALLRMAVHELIAQPDVPAAAIISEAVDLAAEYSTDASSRFVNGVLAKVAERFRVGEEVHGGD
jgi:N utilization substance protein B